MRNGRQRRLHKAFLRYHDAENWPLLLEALRNMGRSDLIGSGKKHLVPSYQPAGTGTRVPVRGQKTQLAKKPPLSPLGKQRPAKTPFSSKTRSGKR